MAEVVLIALEPVTRHGCYGTNTCRLNSFMLLETDSYVQPQIDLSWRHVHTTNCPHVFVTLIAPDLGGDSRHRFHGLRPPR